MKENIKINKEKLKELEKQTKDKFTKLLINDLKKKLYSSKEIGLYERLDFERILNLAKREENMNRLKNSKNLFGHHSVFTLRIIKNSGKKREINIDGDAPLSRLRELIQKEFDLEPGHLYEFRIGEYSFGPECDEWQEIFDILDNFKLDSAISGAKLEKGDSFYFIYDFGENIKFKIKIKEIK